MSTCSLLLAAIAATVFVAAPVKGADAAIATAAAGLSALLSPSSSLNPSSLNPLSTDASAYFLADVHGVPAPCYAYREDDGSAYIACNGNVFGSPLSLTHALASATVTSPATAMAAQRLILRRGEQSVCSASTVTVETVPSWCLAATATPAALPEGSPPALPPVQTPAVPNNAPPAETGVHNPPAQVPSGSPPAGAPPSSPPGTTPPPAAPPATGTARPPAVPSGSASVHESVPLTGNSTATTSTATHQTSVTPAPSTPAPPASAAGLVRAQPAFVRFILLAGALIYVFA